LVDGSELHECIVALHIDTKNLTVSFKDHLKVFTPCGFLIEVDNEEGLGRFNISTSIVFLAPHPPVPSREFSPERKRHPFYFPTCKIDKGTELGKRNGMTGNPRPWQLLFTYIPSMAATKASINSFSSCEAASFKNTKQNPRLMSTRSIKIGLKAVLLSGGTMGVVNICSTFEGEYSGFRFPKKTGRRAELPTTAPLL
jgi:hypothetical protein